MADGGRLVFAFWIFKSRQVTAQRTLRIIFSWPRLEDPEREHRPATIRHERWPHGVLAVDCLPSRSGVPPMRRALQRRSPAARFLLLGPVLVHGVRAVHLSRESTRH